jgi:hypothetical protein
VVACCLSLVNVSFGFFFITQSAGERIEGNEMSAFI